MIFFYRFLKIMTKDTVATFEYNHMIHDLKSHYGFENHSVFQTMKRDQFYLLGLPSVLITSRTIHFLLFVPREKSTALGQHDVFISQMAAFHSRALNTASHIIN